MADGARGAGRRGEGARAFPERDLEQADASVSVEYAQADRRGSRDGATWFQRRYKGRPRRGRLQLERALPACGSGARTGRPHRFQRPGPAASCPAPLGAD